MKKRLFTLVCVLCLLIALPVVLSACRVHDHTYADTWTSDDTYHWHTSTCQHADLVSDKAEHTWDAGTVTTEPTADTEGVLTKTCTVCGKTKTAPIPVTDGHTHSYTPSVTAPTCTEQGYTTHTCACGDTYTDSYTEATGHNVTAWTPNNNGTHTGTCSNGGHSVTENCSYTSAVTAPTCTEQGYTTYTCACGYSYRDTYTNATGHSYKQEYSHNDSYHWHDATCSHTTEKSGYEQHSFTSAVTAPTCTEQGYTTYTCACGYSYKGDYVAATGHTVQNWTENDSTLYDATSCKYAVTYKGECESCHTEQSKTEYIEKHSYYWAITTPATCTEDGVKTKVCNNTECKYHTASANSETQSYSDPDAHTWVIDEANSTDTVTAYKCAHTDCDATKKTMSAADTNVDVSDSDLDNITEVEFPDATIGLDDGIKETLSGSESINISASTLTDSAKQEAVEKADLQDEDLALLGDNPIYSFTITTDKEISQLGGTATIRIPYTLTEGQNPDQIVVWYISDGELEPMPATYSEDADGNGYVTFTTTHFSYYVPAELTPDQYCRAFGHSKDVHKVEPTCTEGGYSICLHCGKQIPGSYTAPTGHNWHSSVVTKTSCSANGTMHFECEDCHTQYDTVIPAIGHLYVLHDHKNATCQEAGSNTFRCIYCQDEYTVTLPQTNHKHTTTVVEPTCTTAGYTQKVCTSCGDTVMLNYTQPTAHTYSTAWNSAEEGHYHVCTVCGERDELNAHTPGAEATEQSAQICTVCEYVITPAISHTHQLTAVAAVAPDCTHSGNIAYYTCACGKWFLDAQAQQLITDHTTVIDLAKGHTPVAMDPVTPTCTEIGYTAGIECSTCHTVLTGHAPIDAYGHRYTAAVTAPTCTAGGHTVYTCGCGDTYTDDETEALGHSYISEVTAPTCTKDGYTTYTCSRCEHTHTDDATAALGHNPASSLSCDADGHWYACTRCNEKPDQAAHTPDYDEATTTHGITCTACGYVIEEIKEHTHSVAKTVNGKAPTCTASGVKTYYVCACGTWFEDEACTTPITEPTSVILPATGHSITTIPATNSTCQEHGYSAGDYCENCQKWLSGHEELPLADHSYENGACTMCGKEEPVVKEILYTYTDTWDGGKAIYEFYNDYTVRGYMESINSDGSVETEEDWAAWEYDDKMIVLLYEGEEIERFTVSDDGKTLILYVCPHEHQNRVETTPATCTERGSGYVECLDCGDIMNLFSTDPLGHSYVDGVCERCGEASEENPDIPDEKAIVYIFTMTEGNVYVRYEFYSDYTVYGYGEMTGSDGTVEKQEAWAKWEYDGDIVVLIYEEEDGAEEMRFTVNNDGKTLSLYIEETCTHENIRYVTVQEATCTQNGITTRVCADCGEKIDDGFGDLITPALGHSYVDGVCERCGESETENPDTPDEKTIIYIYTDTEDKYTLIYEFYANKTIYARVECKNEDGSVSIDQEAWAEWIEKDGKIIIVFEGEEVEHFTIGDDGKTLVPYVCPHENKHTVVVSTATCTTGGSSYVECLDCGRTLQSTFSEALGHSYVDGVCERCGENSGSVEEKVIVYLYTEKGSDYYLNWEFYTDHTVCLRIEYVTEDGTWTKDETWTEWKQDGEEIVVSIGGSEARFTVNEDGKTLTLVEQEEETCLHENTQSVTAMPDCTHEGSTSIYCTDCGKTVEEIYLAPLGHSYVDGVCERCGESESDELANEIALRIKETEETWNNFYKDYDLENALGSDHFYCKKYALLLDEMNNVTTLEELDALSMEIAEIINAIKKDLGIEDEPDDKAIVYFFTYSEDGYTVTYEFYSDRTIYGRVEYVNEDGVTEIQEAWATWEYDGDYVAIIDGGYIVQRFTVNDDGYTLSMVERPDPSECDHLNATTTIKEPTCTESGSEMTHCSDCGTGWGTSFPALGHSFDTNGICERCGISEGDADNELQVYIEEMLQDLEEIWNSYLENGLKELDNFAAYEANYQSIYQTVKSATSTDIIDAMENEFAVMADEIESLLEGNGSDTDDLQSIINDRVDQMESHWNELLGTYGNVLNSLEEYASYKEEHTAYLEQIYTVTTVEDADTIFMKHLSLTDRIRAVLSSSVIYTYNQQVTPPMYDIVFYGNGNLEATIVYVMEDGTYNTVISGGWWEMYEDGILLASINTYKYYFSIAEDGALTLDSIEEPCQHENAVTTTTEATCTSSGFQDTYCPDCGMGWGAELPALGHSYVDGVCERCGESADSEDQELSSAIRNTINDMDITWEKYSSHEKFYIVLENTDYKDRFCTLQEKIMSATSVVEIKLYYTEFEAMMTEISEMLEEISDIENQIEQLRVEMANAWAAYGILVDMAAEPYCQINDRFYEFYNNLYDYVDVNNIDASYEEFEMLRMELTDTFYACGGDVESIRKTLNNYFATSWRVFATDANFKTLENYKTYMTARTELRTRCTEAMMFEEFFEIAKEYSALVEQIEADLSNICVHGNAVIAESKEATCTESGYTLYQCPDCGEKWQEGIPATGHSYTDGKCTVCGACEHLNVVTISIPTNATCTTAGEYVYMCKDCNESWSEFVYGDHSFVDGICEHCGYVNSEAVDIEAYRQELISYINTTWKTYISDTALRELAEYADFNTIRSDIYNCVKTVMTYDELYMASKEFDSLIEKIDVALKDYNAGEAETPCTHPNLTLVEKVDSTCIAGGYETYSCPDCGIGYQKMFALADHTYDDAGICTVCGNCQHLNSEVIESVAATCTASGIEKHACLKCGETWEKVLVPTGHNYDANDFCANCNQARPYTIYNYTLTDGANIMEYAFYSDNTVYGYMKVYNDAGELEEFEEAWAEWVEKDGKIIIVFEGEEVEDFTVGEDGYTLVPYVCPHENTHTVVVSTATCTEGGHSYVECLDCGEILEHSISEALGHSYVDGVCDRCGEASKDETDTPDIGDDEPDVSYDFDGAEVVIMVPTTAGTNWDMVTTEGLSDMINAAVYERNCYTEEKLNVCLSYVQVAPNEYTTQIQVMMNSGACDVDFVSQSARFVPKLVTNGYYADLSAAEICSLMPSGGATATTAPQTSLASNTPQSVISPCRHMT